MEINITLSKSVLRLALGMSVEELRTALMPFNHSENHDAELGEVSFHLPDDGVEINARNGVFRSAFLYLVPPSRDEGMFKGKVDLIAPEFFDAPSEKIFQKSLETRGFVRSARIFPNSIDMLTSEIRLRYEASARQQIIVFDNGAFVR